MNEKTVRQAEVAVPEIAAASLELLAVRAGEASGAGQAFDILLHDRGGRRLLLLDWLPGKGLSIRPVALDAGLPEGALSGSVAGRLLAVSDSRETVLVDIPTGSVRRVQGLAGPTVIIPDGRRLISATDTGLLAMSLWEGRPGEIPFAAGIEPLALADFDSPRVMHILCGEGGDAFGLLVGCYGAAGFAWPREGDLRTMQTRTLSTAPLPYDPVYFAAPAPVAAPPGRQLVYAVDDGAAGLVAINGALNRVQAAELGVPKAYGTVQHVVPSLDSRGCLVRLRSGTTLLWSPGVPPRPITLAHRLPFVWHAGHALLSAEDGATIGEIPFVP